MITTHVLDTAKGRPAEGVAITLEVMRDSWQFVAQGSTDADGRLRSLTENHKVEEATYRLTFDTAAYNHGFFPQVVIVFQIDNPQQHYHVPLLLSPYGYSTYRGS